MCMELKKIGIYYTSSNRHYIESHLNDILNDSTSIAYVENRSYIAKKSQGNLQFSLLQP